MLHRQASSPSRCRQRRSGSRSCLGSLHLTLDLPLRFAYFSHLFTPRGKLRHGVPGLRLQWGRLLARPLVLLLLPRQGAFETSHLPPRSPPGSPDGPGRGRGPQSLNITPLGTPASASRISLPSLPPASASAVLAFGLGGTWGVSLVVNGTLVETRLRRLLPHARRPRSSCPPRPLSSSQPPPAWPRSAR
jgi:hypothetical protein